MLAANDLELIICCFGPSQNSDGRFYAQRVSNETLEEIKETTEFLSGHAAAFVQSVVSLHPRIAVFDCDGTLWSGDAGADFFYWEMKNGIIPPAIEEAIQPRYADYRAGKVEEAAMCGEMVTIHKGIDVLKLEGAAERFFAEIMVPHIFPELRVLTHKLAATGCELWAVSSTNEWVVRAGAARFAIPPTNILAACVESEGNCASDRLLRVPTDQAKAEAIREVIGRPVDAAFGNSMHDAAMLEIASHAFAINPNPDLERLASERNWTIYHPKR